MKLSKMQKDAVEFMKVHGFAKVFDGRSLRPFEKLCELGVAESFQNTPYGIYYRLKVTRP